MSDKEKSIIESVKHFNGAISPIDTLFELNRFFISNADKIEADKEMKFCFYQITLLMKNLAESNDIK
jgi:hypothetical protein